MSDTARGDLERVHREITEITEVDFSSSLGVEIEEVTC
jgi:hypothetical protein